MGYWDSCYGFLYPDWVRFLVPVYGLVSGALLAALFWWVALHLPGNPVLIFAALAGLHSLPGHLWGIFGEGMLERCPILADVGAEPALVFGVFEFILYWSVVLGAAVMAVTVRDRWVAGRRR